MPRKLRVDQSGACFKHNIRSSNVYHRLKELRKAYCTCVKLVHVLENRSLVRDFFVIGKPAIGP